MINVTVYDFSRAALGGALFPVAVGLGSSFTHCAGMCGPIHFLLASKTGPNRSVWMYHAGRICSYSVLGAFAGWLGHAFSLLATPGFRIGAGILIASVYALFGMGLLGWLPARLNLEKNLSFLFPARRLGRMAAGPLPPLFPVGLAAGLLPCPSTHAVLLWSLGLKHVWQAAGAMAMLGVATLPVFVVLPRRAVGGSFGRLYHALLGILFLGLSGWRIYALAAHGAGCH